jgi:hypothetical protein
MIAESVPAVEIVLIHEMALLRRVKQRMPAPPFAPDRRWLKMLAGLALAIGHPSATPAQTACRSADCPALPTIWVACERREPPIVLARLIRRSYRLAAISIRPAEYSMRGFVQSSGARMRRRKRVPQAAPRRKRRARQMSLPGTAQALFNPPDGAPDSYGSRGGCASSDCSVLLRLSQGVSGPPRRRINVLADADAGSVDDADAALGGGAAG